MLAAAGRPLIIKAVRGLAMKLQEQAGKWILGSVCLFLWPALVPPGAGTAFAEEPFQILCDGEATDISADGAVIVGLACDSHKTWRWTRDSGRVLLGQPSGKANEIDWGTPDVSDDGRTISATIIQGESSSETLALWNEDSGWVTPRNPANFPDAGATEQASLAWGLSGDGSTLVGQVRTADSSMRAAAWNGARGVYHLGEPGVNSRANAVNADGSVIVGWSENPETGIWQPTVWQDRRPLVLAATKGFCEATAVTPGGTIIVGQAYDEAADQRVAALWLASDFGWIQETLGVLPGTLAGYGQAKALALTEDGHTIVGFNSFDPKRSTGFVWTLADGMVDVHDYLGDHGVVLPEGFHINAVTGISPDGRFITGHGEDRTFWPHQVRSYLIRVEEFPRDKTKKRVLPAGMEVSNPFKTKKLK
jgi:uncharacterized membrane protein